MKVSEKIKLIGYKDLKEFSKEINKTPATVINWEKENPVLFNMLMVGAKEIKHLEDLKKLTETEDNNA